MEYKFDHRLKYLLTISGVERGELARYLGVPIPMVSRWLNGISVPNVYQLQELAHFFGMPYDWFLEDGDSSPNVDDLSAKLGLSPETVSMLLELVSEAVDNTLCAALAVIDGVFEDLNRYTDKVIVGMEESGK